jgi:hypothetical protein
MRRQAIVEHAEARRQHINRERARLAELQYTVNILHKQEQRQESPFEQLHHQFNANPPPPPPLYNQIPHHPAPLAYEAHHPPPLHHGTTDPKSSLVDHMELAAWPPQYRTAPPTKYHGNTEPRKFLMCYEAAIASSFRDEATLAKYLIISLEDAVANWYSRLPPKCIYSWQQLKEKFLLNFHGFQVELSIE